MPGLRSRSVGAMRLSEALNEGLRNILSGTARALTLVLCLTVLVGGLVVADVLASRAVLDSAAHFRSARANVVVLAAPGHVSGSRCDSLTSFPGVHAAGAFRSRELRLVPAALPGAPLTGYEVSSGFADLMDIRQGDGAGLLLAEDAADSLGLSASDRLVLVDSEAEIHGIYGWEDDGRRSGFGYAAFLPVADSDGFDECWVDAWPRPPQLNDLLLNTQIPSASSASEKPQMGQINTTLGTSFDGKSLYHSRLTRFAPWAAFAISVLIGWVFVRLRRLELASAIHAGVSRGSLAAILGCEIGVWSTAVFVLSGSCTLLITAGITTADRTPIAEHGFAILAMSLCGAMLGTAVAFGATKEEHLFRYFKNR